MDKKPFTDITLFGQNFLTAISNITTNLLDGIGETAFVSLNWTADRFENLSDEKLLHIEDLPILFQKAAEALEVAATATQKGLKTASDSTANAFVVANESLDIADNFMTKTLFENKVISSILGSSHDNLLSFSTIKLSFRLNSEDVKFEEVQSHYKELNYKKAILFVPGLFCDEKLWIKSTDEEFAMGDYLFNSGYYPLYIRYNQGAHISENGKALFDLLEEIYQKEPNIQLSIISYSQGGLVLRSALNYAKDRKSEFFTKINKVLMISSPNGGSYIEKIGFWAGLMMQASPFWFLKILGFIGNLRSDAIKDLSHGIIREEDWKKGNQISRYTSLYYHGELDGLDAYQAYSFLAKPDNPLGLFFGDGIIEKPSIEALNSVYFDKFADYVKRTLVVYESNHFKIMNSEKLISFIDQIFEVNKI
jgi:hypothetical protein